jgi:hypothetical protein
MDTALGMYPISYARSRRSWAAAASLQPMDFTAGSKLNAEISRDQRPGYGLPAENLHTPSPSP